MTQYRRAVGADAERIALLHADSWRRTYRGSYRDEFLDGDVVTNRLGVWRCRLANDREDQFVYLAERTPVCLVLSVSLVMRTRRGLTHR